VRAFVCVCACEYSYFSTTVSIKVDARVSISKDKHGAHTRTHFPKRQQRQNVEEQRFTQLLRAADGPLSAMMAMPLYSSVARALGKRHQRCMQGLRKINKEDEVLTLLKKHAQPVFQAA